MTVKRWQQGDSIPALTLETIHDTSVDLPMGAMAHLQFRRFAGCPVCNLHLRSFVRRRSEIEAAGIQEVVFFHSPAELLREHAGDLPFAIIADPGKRFYAMFGAEAGRRALFDPRAWGGILKSVVASVLDVLLRRNPVPPINPEGGRWGLPADLLIDRGGTIVAVKYGEHANDQWSVDEVIQLALRGQGARPPVLHHE